MVAGETKILVFGATGYLGKYMVEASESMGHPTYAYVRPTSSAINSSRFQTLCEFKSMGVIVHQGHLDEHDKLVHAIQQVDVVISALAVPQYLDQLKIIEAIKEAGNIKRFVPSEYGNEVDRVFGLPPFQAILDNKKKIRRAIEAAGIPYTFVSANSFAAYFIDFLLHPHEQRDEVTIYGSGEAKVVLNFEEDIAAYTIKAVNDSRTLNRIIIYRPPENIVSQLEMISLLEMKTGRKLNKVHVTEEEAVRLSETLPHPDNVRISILHNIFIKGTQMSFELGQKDLEASDLYPEYKYTSFDQLLNRCILDSPKTKLATF
ncbi:isoeugenol synthase 1 [Cinnamomum micranthum f. kanehirae]|uniref:Isoeugenol synthase 1 n=1 Tax=Cinnamomum micranthum f. kanehirae TaxID=337451 RepID=A0A3S3MGI5_9MAGN|nr:isoeugenol synthase 1 [Cinnamomum micranthum f. kanehirae]